VRRWLPLWVASLVLFAGSVVAHLYEKDDAALVLDGAALLVGGAALVATWRSS